MPTNPFNESRVRHSGRAAKGVLGVLGLLLVGAAALMWHQRRQQVEQLEGLLNHYGVLERRPQLRSQLEREVDPSRRQLEASRALIGDTLDPAAWAFSQSTISQEDLLEEAVDKLEASRQLASGVLARQPDSWRANLYVGASTYLTWSMQRDERLVREVERWRGPIERSRELAPRQNEPKTFLTLTQLELWQMLSGERKQQTRTLLADAWTGSPVDQRILSAWIRVAPKDMSLFDPLPDDPQLLSFAQGELAAISRWDLAIIARHRQIDAVTKQLNHALERAARALRSGDLRTARTTLARGVPAEPSALQAAGVETLLAMLPAGPLARVDSRRLTRWLDWALDLDLYGVPAFSMTTLERLVNLSDSVDDESRLRVRLIVAGLSDAERERQDLEGRGASEPLERYGVHLTARLWRDPLARTSVPVAGNLAANTSAVPEDLDVLQRVAAGALRSASGGEPDRELIGDWLQVRPGVHQVEIWLPSAIDRIDLPLVQVGPEGAAVEVFWNEQALGTFQRFANQPPLRLAHYASRGVHRLQVRALSGSFIVPGGLSLQPIATSNENE